MSKTRIPASTRRDLWIQAGGRCEFKGCMKPLDQNFLTGQSVVLGEYCHIVADSPQGPRGDDSRNTELAKDPSNLIVCCSTCHTTIDDSSLTGVYSIGLLRSWKEEHEAHIRRIYEARDVERSIPLIIVGSIASTPTSISEKSARAVVLKKSSYSRFPSHEAFRIDLGSRPLESDPVFYRVHESSIIDQMDRLSRRIAQEGIQHVDVFGLAPIPILALVGYKLGDRIKTTVHQAQRTGDSTWLWPPSPNPEGPSFSYTLPNLMAFRAICLAVEISGVIPPSEISGLVPKAGLGTFGVPSPSASIVDCESVLEEFSNEWRKMLGEIHSASPDIVVHVFAAVPNSLAFEMGRSLHPHACPRLVLWTKVNGSFINALTL